MFSDTRIWLWKLIGAMALSVLVCFSAPFANAAAADTRQSPEAVATAFYSWYVGTIAGHRDPMTDYPNEFAAFVAKPLIAGFAVPWQRRAGGRLFHSSAGLSR
jgi:hypothetical protein